FGCLCRFSHSQSECVARNGLAGVDRSEHRNASPCRWRDRLLRFFPNTRDSPSSRPFISGRSEEHMSELQSPCNLVCRLLLEKKKPSRSSTISSYERWPSRPRAFCPISPRDASSSSRAPVTRRLYTSACHSLVSGDRLCGRDR